MKYFYLYIFLLLFFIFLMSYNNTYNNTQHNLNRELFTSNNKAIILLGDSILKNNSYVENGQGIDNILTEKTDSKTYSYAEDGSIIVDIYNQLDKIPLELNEITTTIYISAGGNDILNHYVNKIGDITNMEELSNIFLEYTKLIKSIQTRFNKCKIVLLDIYYPDNNMYKQYHSVIREWNNMIYKYADNQANKVTSVLKVSTLLTHPKDFVFSIEPSSVGGEKIVNSILTTE